MAVATAFKLALKGFELFGGMMKSFLVIDGHLASLALMVIDGH
jgi:hypothetical protein